MNNQKPFQTRVIMKRTIALIGTAFFSLGVAVDAATSLGGGGGARGGGMGRSSSIGHSHMGGSAGHSVMIQMNHYGDAGGYHSGHYPSYGQTHWGRSSGEGEHEGEAGDYHLAQPSFDGQGHGNLSTRGSEPSFQQPLLNAQAERQPGMTQASGTRVANAVHHHPYTQGYIRGKLLRIGVKSEPSYITDRSEIVSSDRAHSAISFPQTGPRGEAFKGTLVSPRQFNSPVVRNQMAIVSRPDYMKQIDREGAGEMQRNHVYWHSGSGFDYAYAHYIDNSGFQWYGWYTGDQFFWTRNYNGRWWWYDTGFNRWDFYNNNYWWWQDPHHVGELYVYNNDGYIPANSADDQVVVTGAIQSNELVYNSPDGNRSVKVAQGDGDAYLNDTASPPSFAPVYMASGVTSIQFSDPNNGRPQQIVLRLDDGSYDIFDEQGHPFHYETADTN
jgi:hypothetical protein